VAGVPQRDAESYSVAPWLRYVIDHFLKPGGHAGSDPRFEDFAFDHVLSGTIVGCRPDNEELSAIRVEDNEVSREVMGRADPRYVDYAPLPYEEEIYREVDGTRRRRR
jgi:hypothetical protein